MRDAVDFMLTRIHSLKLLALFVILAAASATRAQETPPATLAPTPPSQTIERDDEQEPVKVYTQEVRLPVVAYDEHERFDPTLRPDDILVVEGGVPQQVRSVRRVPANVLLVFDLGGQVTATQSGNATREAALGLVARLREGDRLAVIQNSGRVELLRDWTTDAGGAAHTLRAKFFTGRRSRLSECLAMAAMKLREQPVGNTHVIVFTDGLEAQSKEKIQAEPIGRAALADLVATQANVHVFCFAALVEDAVKNRGGGIDMDFEMRRWFKRYARATRQREEQLAELAKEAGGRVLLPKSSGEIAEQVGKVSRDIGAQYVLTYTSKRPFTPENAGERRPVRVSPRRTGLRLLTLRSHVSAPTM